MLKSILEALGIKIENRARRDIKMLPHPDLTALFNAEVDIVARQHRERLAPRRNIVNNNRALGHDDGDGGPSDRWLH
jgi:hypothetical protein